MSSPGRAPPPPRRKAPSLSRRPTATSTDKPAAPPPPHAKPPPQPASGASEQHQQQQRQPAGASQENEHSKTAGGPAQPSPPKPKPKPKPKPRPKPQPKPQQEAEPGPVHKLEQKPSPPPKSKPAPPPKPHPTDHAQGAATDLGAGAGTSTRQEELQDASMGHDEERGGHTTAPDAPKPQPRPKPRGTPSSTAPATNTQRSAPQVTASATANSAQPATAQEDEEEPEAKPQPPSRPTRPSHRHSLGPDDEESHEEISQGNKHAAEPSPGGMPSRGSESSTKKPEHTEEAEPIIPARPSTHPRRTSLRHHQAAAEKQSEDAAHAPTRPRPPRPVHRPPYHGHGGEATHSGDDDSGAQPQHHHSAHGTASPAAPASPSLSTHRKPSLGSRQKPGRPPKPALQPSRPPPPAKGKPARPAKPQRPKPPGNEPPPLPPRPRQGHPLYHYMVTGPRLTVLFDWPGEKEGDLSVSQGDILRLLEWVSPEWVRADNDGQQGVLPVIFVDVVEDLPVSGPRVVATYDFEAELDHELTFGIGDEIELLGVINDDWMRGRRHGKEGAFPSSFVEVVEPLQSTNHEGWPEEWAATIHAADAEAAAQQQQQQELSAEGMTVEQGLMGTDASAHEGAQAAEIASSEGGAETTVHTGGEHPQHKQEGDATPAATALSHDGQAKTAAGAGETPCALAVFDYEGQAPDDLSFTEGQQIELVRFVNEEWLVGRCNNSEGMFPAAFVEVVVPLPPDAIDGGNGTAPHAVPTALHGDDADGDQQQQHTHAHAHAHASSSAPEEQNAGDMGAAPISHDTTAIIREVRVAYDWEGETEEDLPLVVGTTISVVEEVNEDWLRGRGESGREGMFPAAFVEEM